MRTREVLREGLRNVLSGASRSGILAVLLAALLSPLALVDAVALARIHNEALDFRAAGASTLILQSPGGVDGARCEALDDIAGIVATGALARHQQDLRFAILPSVGVSSYQVSPGFAAFIRSQEPISPALYLEHRLADDLGITDVAHERTNTGAVVVMGVFAVPEDQRQPLLDYSVITVEPVSAQRYDECWAEVWPSNEAKRPLLFSALDTSADADAEILQWNSSLGAEFDQAGMEADRLTRYMPAAAFLLVLVTVSGFLAQRRLEFATSCHLGVTRRQLALQLAFENLLSLLPAAALSTALSIVLLQAIIPLTWRSGLPAAAATVIAAACGAQTACLLAGALARESALMKLYKSR